jgi:hypothetical protein
MTSDAIAIYLFQTAPTPIRAAAWIIFGTLIWLLVSFPARWAWNVVREAHAAFSQLLRGARASLLKWREVKEAMLLNQISVLVPESGLYKADERGQVMHSALASPIHRVLETAAALIADTDASLRTHLQTVSRLTGDLSRMRSTLDATAMDKYLDESFRHRSSRSRLIVSLALLLFIVPVNAVMLSQILDALAIVPKDAGWLPFSLSYPIAVVLTIMEAALGWVYHSSSSRKPSDAELPASFSLRHGGVLLATVGLAGVEGFFYGIVGAQQGGLGLQLGDVVIESRYVFALWGFLIVVVLCCLASAATSAWFDRVERATVLRLRDGVHELDNSFAVLDSRGKAAHEKWNSLIDLAAACRRTLGAGDDAKFIESAIAALRKDVVNAGVSGRATSQQHDPTSAMAVVTRLSLFLGLSLIAWLALSAVSAVMISTLRPQWSALLSGVGAVCLGLPCIAVGMLIEPRLLYLRDTSQGLQPLTPRSNRFLARALAAGIGVTLLATAVLSPSSVVAVIVITAACLGLVFLVREITPGASLISAVLTRWNIVAVSRAALAAYVVGVAIQWVLSILVWTLRLLAQPYLALSPERPRSEQVAPDYV